MVPTQIKTLHHGTPAYLQKMMLLWRRQIPLLVMKRRLLKTIGSIKPTKTSAERYWHEM